MNIESQLRSKLPARKKMPCKAKKVFIIPLRSWLTSTNRHLVPRSAQKAAEGAKSKISTPRTDHLTAHITDHLQIILICSCRYFKADKYIHRWSVWSTAVAHVASPGGGRIICTIWHMFPGLDLDCADPVHVQNGRLLTTAVDDLDCDLCDL